MIKIYYKAFPLTHPEEAEKEIQFYIDSGYEILSMTSESHGEFGCIMAVMKWDEANSDLWTGHTVRCGGKLYEVVACSPDPFIVFDDGSKHYGITIVSIDGNSNDWMLVNDAQVELVEDKNESIFSTSWRVQRLYR